MWWWNCLWGARDIVRHLKRGGLKELPPQFVLGMCILQCLFFSFHFRKMTINFVTIILHQFMFGNTKQPISNPIFWYMFIIFLPPKSSSRYPWKKLAFEARQLSVSVPPRGLLLLHLGWCQLHQMPSISGCFIILQIKGLYFKGVLWRGFVAFWAWLSLDSHKFLGRFDQPLMWLVDLALFWLVIILFSLM